MRQIRRRPSRATVLVLAVSLVAVLGAAPAQAENRSIAAEGGLGTAAFLSTLPYGMAKLLWALTGSLGAGMAWCFTGGDGETANKILTGALRGTYVLTPEHLTGKQNIDFIGRSPENKAAHESMPESMPNW